MYKEEILNEMNERELKQIQDYVKGRYAEVSLDYQTFTGEVDMDLTYEEQKRLCAEHLDKVLPKVVPKLKRECSMNKEQAKIEQEAMLKAEQEKQEAEIKAKFEKEIEIIINTKTSEEIEKLYAVPDKYIKMVAHKEEVGLLLYGDSSKGKTYRVKKVLAEEGKKEGVDYFIISGHITPLQFFTKLYQARDKIVVFDDCNILENKINLNMLKAALNENSHGKVEYHTSKQMPDGVPPSFVFTGQVIVLINDKPKNSKHLEAVENRILVYHLKFSYEEMIRILFDVAKADNIEINQDITKNERFGIVRWIKDNTNIATKNLNLRLYQHIIRFYKSDKDKWEELARNYIQNDEYTTMIIQGCSDDEWVEKTGLSRATKMRIKSSLNLTRAYGTCGINNNNNISNVSMSQDFTSTKVGVTI